MMTNTKEGGLETIIVSHLRDVNGYTEGTSDLYSKDEAIVKSWLETFLVATQPDKVARSMCFVSASEKAKFYARLCEALAKRGVTDVLRNGFAFNGTTFDMYFPLPSEQNPSAKEAYEKNCFGVIRQLHYSKIDTNDAIDFVVFINGLPLATFELKNHYTRQTVENAIKQYQTDRNPKEVLLKPKRCAVHFAVDDTDVYMCTELKGAESWFLPFNRGVNGGAGNPVIPGKTMTSYLWEEVFDKRSLSNIIENFAQVIVTEEKKTHRLRERVIWPRYHQLDAVRRILETTSSSPVGRRFLIQHSAGSGKSNTITWLAYQLVMVQETVADVAAVSSKPPYRVDVAAVSSKPPYRDVAAVSSKPPYRDVTGKPKFDSIIVVTDRVNLDKQIRDNINAFAKLRNIVGWADQSKTLRELLQGGKKIIVSTIHKFSFILDEIGSSLRNKSFAIVIDEAHSSQGGDMALNMSASVSGNCGDVSEGEAEDVEERIYRIVDGHKLAKNANYYAFTATPKNKTLEMFGERFETHKGVMFMPFHEYTMRQAIEEGFILDVLKHYTPYKAYFEVIKKSGDDPKFDRERSFGLIKAFVERQPETIKQKCQIIVEHFCARVFNKIGGKARAMVVTSSIERAIEFYKVISGLLLEKGGKFKAIVAFTDKEIGGKVVSEASLNGFPSSLIEEKFVEEPYRILVVADKYQTGFDEPLLHTMYVDKILSGLKAVQTLSRLNRAHPKKFDTFVLDFVNTPEDICSAFQPYYKTTIMAGESDVNKLHDLIEKVEYRPFYTVDDRENVVRLKLSGKIEDRPQIDAILDGVAARFRSELSVEEQVCVKRALKEYRRCYSYFAAIMPYNSADWERQYIFYSLLISKLPQLKRESFVDGLAENIELDKYCLQMEEERSIRLEDIDVTVAPIPVGSGGGGVKEVELDSLSRIIEDFNAAFGGIEWSNADEVRRQILELPKRMAQNESFANAVLTGNKDVAQIKFNDEIQGVVASMSEERMEFMRNYYANTDFQNLVNERVKRCSERYILEQSRGYLRGNVANGEGCDGMVLSVAEGE